MKALCGIDIQMDFINGSLGTPEAEAAVAHMIMAIDKAIHKRYYIFMTKDTHAALEEYLKTAEGQKLPIGHCEKDTPGWEFPVEIITALMGYSRLVIIEKDTFGTYDLMNELWALENRLDCIKREKLEEVYFCGLVTNICVVSNAIMAKAALPNVPITVLARACAGTTPERHEWALGVMQDCQINISEGGVE